jgi:CHRD domain/PEP-CTERM motif
MKTRTTLSLLAAAALALAAALPAHATVRSFTTTLSGAAETPPTGSAATGSALVVFDDVLSTVTVSLTFAGLSAPATAGHIHCCAPVGSNVGVALGFSGFPSATSGSYTNTFGAGAYTGANTFASVLAGTIAGQSYVNIHNAIFPGGEIRGFLVAAVPEPSTYALMLGGMALVAGAARRRATRR